VIPYKERYFEDYAVGESAEFGVYEVTQEEIVSFARAYDPQRFHTDPEAARHSSFGGLVASGWMTCGIAMRLLWEHFIPERSAMGASGVDKLRWLRPVRPGDRLSVRVTVLAAEPSGKKPDRGTVVLRQEVINQHGETVMSLEGRALHRRRGGFS
jgi:acyl dehydratase